MMAIGNVLIVDDGGGDTAGSMAAFHVIKKRTFEILGIVVDDSGGILAKDDHLSLVGVAHTVALESVLIPTLLVAHLAVPSEFLQT